MKLAISLAALAACASATAIETKYFPGCSRRHCLTQRMADKFVSRFIGVLEHKETDLGNFTETMEIMLADDFQEISDSINSLAGIPLGSVTTGSKEEYIQETQNAPPDSNIETIFTAVAACRNIIWHWNFPTVGSAQYPVKGMNYFELNENCQIDTMRIEFNSIAWGADTGFTTTPPSGPPPGTTSNSTTS
ncbi:uncharacterized protein LTR77_006110 [Saxophila tyrrhenica]|uniref:NTF2-like domain-containing protein n=1 Tax=Saxophila tyrrhenica TaxID=1690608 RepID=A0AAV9P940_9PEZI|nr:hypothetical protein LTR77_006110 [Saxophila tyrrhenica]